MHFCYYEKIGDITKNITKEIPFEIPNNWKWVRLRDCLNEMESTKPSGTAFQYIDIDAIDNKTQIVSKPKNILTQSAPSRATRKLHCGDTLFSLVRPYLMNIAYINNEHANCIASTGFYVCSPNKSMYDKYLYTFLTTPYLINNVMQYMKGDNSPSIRGENLENVLTPLPPFTEQQRIYKQVTILLQMLKDEI